MKNTPSFEAGFTAVELLITLIIASMFIYSGYQLYSQVNRDGTEARRTAIVSSVTTAKLQSAAKSYYGQACAGVTPPSPVTEAISGVGNVIFTYSVACPNSTLPNLKLVKIDASYDSSTKKVSHATYSR